MNGKLVAIAIGLLLSLGSYTTAHAAHLFVHFLQSNHSHIHQDVSAVHEHAHEHPNGHHEIILSEIPTGILPAGLQIQPDLGPGFARGLQNSIGLIVPEIGHEIYRTKDPPVSYSLSHLDFSLTYRAPPA